MPCRPTESRLFLSDGAPWLGLTALLLLCVGRGLWFGHGLAVPPDVDTVRDIGFIRGIMDGNVWGDPMIAGAWRWYPPLFHALAAAFCYLTGIDPLPLWTTAGMWLNLATPAAFFLLNRRLLGIWQALGATGVMVLFDGAAMSGDEAVGYTPWTFTPALAWPLFFLGVGMLHRVTPALRTSGAIAVGCVLGIVFLAHTVPAILLSGMATVLALAQPGDRRRALVWLAVVGGVELLWAAPFLGPLAVEYRLHIANPVPGAWVHPLFDDIERMLWLSLPAMLALAWLRYVRASAPAGTIALLVAWSGLCLGFLGRHAACADGLADGVICEVLVVSPHHFHVYLQAAEASVIGWAIYWAALKLVPRARVAAAAMATLALCGGIVALFLHPWDRQARADVAANGDTMLDLVAYDWILSHTQPHDCFVILPSGEAANGMGPAAATVIAAGRQLLAPPETHTNPYIPWAPLNARRFAYLASAGGSSGMEPAYLLLPVATDWPGEAIFRSASHVVYRVGGGRRD